MSGIDGSLEGSGLERTPTRHEPILKFERLLKDNKGGIIVNPVRYIPDHRLREFLEPLKRHCGDAVTMEDLERGAKLAKMEHSLDLDRETPLLTEAEKRSLRIQRSSAFWQEPKDFQLTLAVCCIASAVQGWDQVANGNLGWPGELHCVDDTTIFALVQAVPWFSAAILGSYLSDPLSEYIGRRRALFVAGLCSLASSVAGSRVTSWQALIGTRVILGLGIGGKASIVPVLLSEMVPSSKRGRLLVSWQTFTAAGLAAGSIACYILYDGPSSWRNQYLSGAIPALLLLVSSFASCESPRWLIVQEEYEKAYITLRGLRKENVLAAKELVSIHYQILVEGIVFNGRLPDPESTGPFPSQGRPGRSTYRERLYNMVWFPRIRRAAIAAMVVMIAQQLSGINIYAFMATQFYTTYGPLERGGGEVDSLRFGIGFGLANMIFSSVAYFLVENKDLIPECHPTLNEQDARNRRGPNNVREPSSMDISPREAGPIPSNQTHRHSTASSSVSSFKSEDYHHKEENRCSDDKRKTFRGRRFLLLTSLAAGVITLLLTATMLGLPTDNKAREPMIIIFTLLFTAFYSPGAGAIPFLYCAEIFPNEGRELGMSWSTFWNFLGAGVLAFSVPFGIERWHHGHLLGLFSGLNAVAFILVWFFVPSTNHTATLEDMSYVFGRKMREHARAQGKRLMPGSKSRGPNLQWLTENTNEEQRSGSQASNIAMQELRSRKGEHRQETEQLPELAQVAEFDAQDAPWSTHVDMV
ncbi:MAG: hypothetical protein Q9219_006600 [cf. Caloplaca sp. 3 TL-2023]